MHVGKDRGEEIVGSSRVLGRRHLALVELLQHHLAVAGGGPRNRLSLIAAPVAAVRRCLLRRVRALGPRRCASSLRAVRLVALGRAVGE